MQVSCEVIAILLPLLALVQVCVPAAAALQTKWTAGYDSTQDYEVLSLQQAASAIECTALASRLSEAQMVTYNSSTAECKFYKCRLALSSCRKCRNLNSANQQVWVVSSMAATCWTTVQHRVSASVDFYQNWAGYKLGFGDGPSANYWIGLDSLHSLTSVSGGRKLLFLMKAWNGSESWAQYSSFSVGPESDSYRMSVSGFTSSHSAIGDSFSATMGYKFTTKDADNDNWSGNCAVNYNGAWWFNSCSMMHPNGPYQPSPMALNTAAGQGIVWVNGYGFTYSLMEIEMLVL